MIFRPPTGSVRCRFCGSFVMFEAQGRTWIADDDGNAMCLPCVRQKLDGANVTHTGGPGFRFGEVKAP